MKEYFTSESVTEAHPDKLCDTVSDAILDAILAQDPRGRVAVEAFATNGLMLIAGEITTSAYVDIPAIARQVIKDAGYTNPDFGFHWANCGVVTAIQEQSPNIATGIRVGGPFDGAQGKKEDFKKLGAGDQGCLKKGTLVRTKRGFVPIERVRSGDFVATPYGFKKVLESRKTGKKKIIGLSFSNGVYLECTPDHKIFCYDRSGRTHWKAASALSEGDFVTSLKPQTNFSDTFLKSFVNRSKFFTKYNHKIFGPEELICDENLGYIEGELIGDGCVTKSNWMTIAFGRNNQHAKFVQNVADGQMPKQWRLVEGRSDWNLKIDSVVVREHFKNFGILFTRASGKTTPKSIFQSPPDVIRAYLRGLFDSDGTIVSNTGRKGDNIRVRLGSSSLGLLRETQLLLNDFGIKSSILFNTRKGSPVGKGGLNGKKYKSNYDSYVLSLIGFESYQKFCKKIGFLNSKKRERAEAYLRNTRIKPKNSRGIFFIPHPRKNEMNNEKSLGKNYPFSVVVFKKKIDKNEKATVP